MQWTDEIRLETPEQIGVDLELAGLGTRFLARMVDWLLKLAVSVVLVVAVGIPLLLAGGVGGFEAVGAFAAALVITLGYLLWLGYDVFCEARYNGQTVGKWVAGIRVIRDSGAPLDFQAAGVRNLLRFGDFLPGVYLFGAFLILVTARRQRLGDLAAGTIVVRERVEEAPEETAAVIQKYASPEYVFSASQLSACTANDRNVLRSFFQRLDQLEGPNRAELARKLAFVMLAKTGYAPEYPIVTGKQAAVFLASLFRDLEQQARRGY
jgi:uncharacterized RDD family membrane protein YckC